MPDLRPNEPRSMTVDEFLESQTTQPILVTMEPVQNVPDKVAVRPYIEGARCLCHLILLLSKDNIASVTPTGKYDQCCGKPRAVVEIRFKDGSAMPLPDLFSQLGSSLAVSISHSGLGARPSH